MKGGDDVKPFFILISDDYIAADIIVGYEVGVDIAIPHGYGKAYRVPGTTAWVYCRVPLNYVMIAIEWTWRMYWKSTMWIPKYILYRGKWYDEEWKGDNASG